MQYPANMNLQKNDISTIENVAGPKFRCKIQLPHYFI